MAFRNGVLSFALLGIGAVTGPVGEPLAPRKLECPVSVEPAVLRSWHQHRKVVRRWVRGKKVDLERFFGSTEFFGEITGIVHAAPAFGEVDFELLKREQKADPSLPLLCAVRPDGRFDPEVAPDDFAGRWVKEADGDLVRALKARGLCWHAEQIRHEYPFCVRSDDDPLIQLARPAWYIRTTAHVEEALADNARVQWLPEHIRDGRFGDFLRNNVDWALSRERFWGTPLNVWKNDGTPAPAVG